MTAWNDLTVLEQLSNEFSDFYKEVNGFRPRGLDAGWTEEDYAVEFVRLSRQMKENDEAEANHAVKCAAEFEAAVQSNIAVGAADRETAARWFFETNGFDSAFSPRYSQDLEHVLWNLSYPQALWDSIIGEAVPAYHNSLI